MQFKFHKLFTNFVMFARINSIQINYPKMSIYARIF